MILKTYARVVTSDMQATLAALGSLTSAEIHLRFTAADLEIAAIADFCVIAAPVERHADLRSTVGPIVVEDLMQMREKLLNDGAEIIQDCFDAPTGRVLYARNLDGVTIEWLQFAPKYLAKAVL